MTTHTYSAEGFRPVRADNVAAAASIFADRLARRRFGRQATVPVDPRQDSWSRDGSSALYVLTVGRRLNRTDSAVEQTRLTIFCRPAGKRASVSTR